MLDSCPGVSRFVYDEIFDSDSERSVSLRCNLIFDGGGVAGNGRGTGETGGFGSFLCVLNGVFDLGGGLDTSTEPEGGVGNSKASECTETAVFVGVFVRSETEIPRPGVAMSEEPTSSFGELEGCPRVT